MKHKKNPVSEIVVLSNPRHRGHKRRRHHVRHRRNPSGGSMFSTLKNMLVEGAVGAAGAVANDVAFGYAKKFLPESLQSGIARTGVKLGFAALTGMLVGKIFAGKGKAVAVGAATVTIHEFLAAQVNANLPSVPMGAYEDNLLGYDSAETMGAYMRPGSQVGAYMQRGAGVGDLLPS
jgi:hypothetical protein